MTDGPSTRHGRAARVRGIAARRIAAPILFLGLAVAACQPPSPSPDQSGAAPPASTGAARAELVVGCISIQAAECRFVAERIAAVICASETSDGSIDVSGMDFF